MKIFSSSALLTACLVPAMATAQVAASTPAAGETVATPAPAVSTGLIAGKIAPPPPGQGQVVFFRKGGFVGSAISCAVHENGTKLSSLPPGRYIPLAMSPGIHNFAVKSESTDTLRMEIEPGETYFAKCAIGMGVIAGRPNLSPSDEATFVGMKKLKLVEDKKVAKK